MQSISTQIIKIPAEHYNPQWADEIVLPELLQTSAFRRQLTLLNLKDWIKSFNDEWSFNHSIQISEEVCVDTILLNRRSYQTNLIEFTVLSNTVESEGNVSFSFGTKKVISRLKCVEELEEFYNENIRALSDIFLIQALKLINKLVTIFGPGIVISIGRSDNNIQCPHLRFKFESIKPNFNFTAAILFLSPK